MASHSELLKYLKVHNNEYKKEEGEEEEIFSYAMQLASSTMLSMSLQCAIELGVFDIIANAGKGAMLSPAKITAQMATKNPEAPIMLDRILRMLASHSVLSCSMVHNDNNNNMSNFQRLYGLGPVSKYFLANDDGASLGPLMALIQDKLGLDYWPQLKHSIIEGGVAFNRAHGRHPFEYLSLDPRFKQVFNTAMYNHTTIVIKNILKFYKGFENLEHLVDVGGGIGVSLKLITSKYSHIKGINFDMPYVIEHAPSYPGVQHVGGDMFDKVPIGDAIFMKWVLHNWSDDNCIKLLKNCYKAIPNGGKIIVVDEVFPIELKTNTAMKSTSQFDVLMMTTLEGRERSQQDFLALAIGAGFSGVKFECFLGDFWVMEFLK